MCFVLGQNFGLLTISMQGALSSNTRHFTFGLTNGTGIPFSRSSVSNFIKSMTSLRAVDSAISSSSVVDNATNDCSLEPQRIGHPTYVMI